MKRETIEKRINENLLTKKGTLKGIYEEVLWWIIYRPADRIHTKSWAITKTSKKLIDKSQRYLDVLNAIGLEYVEGNDAPRGGENGYYIELTKKGRRQIADYAKAYKR